MESIPDLSLPTSIVALYCRLKARFTRRGINDHDANGQRHTSDTAQGIRLSWPLKNGAIIKLDVVGKAKLTPMTENRIYHDSRRYSRPWPRTDQAAMKRYTVQDFDMVAPFDNQTFHNIKAVKFSFSFSKIRQIPPFRWSRPSNSAFTVKLTPTLENIVDRTNRKYYGVSFASHFTLDGFGPIFS